MNYNLRETYRGLAKKLNSSLSKEAIENLQNEWREWFKAYDVRITDDVIDAAVITAAGLAKQHAETIGTMSRGDKRARSAQLSTLLSTDVISTAVLASLRPTPVSP